MEKRLDWRKFVIYALCGVVLLMIFNAVMKENQPIAPTAEASPKTWQVVKEWNLDTNTNTEPFQTNGRFRVSWEVRPDKVSNFCIFVYTPERKFVDMVVNDGFSTTKGGSTEIYESGEFYLSIRSRAPYTVVVEELR